MATHARTLLFPARRFTTRSLLVEAHGSPVNHVDGRIQTVPRTGSLSGAQCSFEHAKPIILEKHHGAASGGHADERVTPRESDGFLLGAAGAFDLDVDFVKNLADACAANGAMLIVDEVQTGMGRCGEPFVADIYAIKPDILTAAKSLAGGFPCGALITTGAIAAETGSGDLGTTFGGGPLACALVKTVIEVIKRDNLMLNVRASANYLASKCPVGPVEGIQGKGFLLGLRCTRPAAQIRNELLEKDILVGTSTDPNVIRLLPALITEQAHFEKLLDCLAELPGE